MLTDFQPAPARRHLAPRLVVAATLALASVAAADVGLIGNFVVPSPTEELGTFGSALATGDFDGDGLVDLAVGANLDATNFPGNGRVDVFLADGVGFRYVGSQLWALGSQFGWALAAGDFDDDGVDEIAVGAPGESVAFNPGAGRVFILRWNPNTELVTVIDSFTQPDLGETAEQNDRFGYALAVGDFDGNGVDDLAIGAPKEGVDTTGGTVAAAGLVHVIHGFDPGGLSQFVAQTWTQESPGVRGSAQTDDNFGSALAAGDFNHDGIDDLAIGIPGESTTTVQHVGMAAVLYGSNVGITATNNALVAEGLGGLPGTGEPNDHLGVALAAGDFSGDGIDDLAVGSPSDALAGAAGAGAIFVVRGTGTGLSGIGSLELTAKITTGADGLANENFGAALAVADFDGDGLDELVIGSPGVAGDQGATDVVTWTGLGLSFLGSARFTATGLASGPPASPDRFGAALTTGDVDGNGLPDLAIGIPRRISATSVADVGLVQILRSDSLVLFFDRFETGDTAAWSATVQ